MARMEKEKSDEGNPYLPRKVMEVMPADQPLVDHQHI
jgi:hypothetical protein